MPNASGCGDGGAYGYESSPFQVGLIENYDHNGDKAGYEETLDFWEEYVKGGVSRSDIRYFFDNATLDSVIDARPYRFLNFLKDHNDQNALTYIKYCLELNEHVNRYMGDLWSYEIPDTSEIEEFIKRISKASTSKEFKPRYEFLKIRSYGAIKDNAGVMKVWDKNKKMLPSPLRDRMEGYVGGVLYREGKYPEALDYFSKTGDRNSIEWCVEKLAGTDNLTKLYNHNPNSGAIPFILQDFMNYIIGSTNAGRLLNAGSGAKFYNNNYEEVTASDLRTQINDMKNLCDIVLSEGKSDNLKMWATALGVLQAIEGNPEKAIQTLHNAENLSGDALSDKNFENFKLWVLLLNSGKGNYKADEEFASALETKYNQVRNLQARKSKDYSKEAMKRRKNWETKNDTDYEFLTQFMREEVPAHFILNHQPEKAMAYLAMMEDMPVDYNSSSFYYSLQSGLNEELTLDQAKSFREYVVSDKDNNNPIDRVMKKYADKYENLANDVVGTRLMREGKFKEALPYLAEVDKKWIGTQPIASYLRSYLPSADYYNFQRNYTQPSPAGITNNYNYKANFCAEMIEAMEDFDNLSGDKKAHKALDLAALCHYASPLGDGWALSDYAWSSTEPTNEFTEMMKTWINKSLSNAQSDKTKNLAYFALLSIPDTKQKSTYGDFYYYEFPYGYTTRNNNKVDRYYLVSPSAAQKTGLTFIKSHWNQNDMPYQMSHCDVLKSYVAGNFISKPSYY